jgi:2-succinyl-5-enolpyruvyl-6-hydroxy-3-cyclohexene-1-carboxylate synthase
VTLLIGDLSFFHDMNGLMVAKRYALDITIVVINNNGGGIFSFLSQAEEKKETFETLFGTPLDIDIEAVARLYGANYSKAVDLPSFTKALDEGKTVKGLKIIEAVTVRKENAALHRDLWSRVVRAVDHAMERNLI